MKIQREELARKSNTIQQRPQENVDLQNSPDFHGWPTKDYNGTESPSDNEILIEFLDGQKETEEIIFRENQDAELARQIQGQTDSPVQSTSYDISNTTNTENPKVSHKLIDLTDDSISDIEDTQEICELPDIITPTKKWWDTTKKFDNSGYDKLSVRDYKNLDLNNFIDNKFISHQSEQLQKLKQEKEDAKMAKDLQRIYEEEDRKSIPIGQVETRNSPFRSKSVKQSPVSAKRQLSIKEYMCQDYRKKAKR